MIPPYFPLLKIGDNTNSERVDHGILALQGYCKLTESRNQGVETTISDLLADIRHVLCAMQLDGDEILEAALVVSRNAFLAEQILEAHEGPHENLQPAANPLRVPFLEELPG